MTFLIDECERQMIATFSLKFERKLKSRAVIYLTLEGHLAPKLLNNMVTNDKSKADTILVDALLADKPKQLEKLILVFFLDANSSIDDRHPDIIFDSRDLDGNATFKRKLESVRLEAEYHLCKSLFIGLDVEVLLRIKAFIVGFKK